MEFLAKLFHITKLPSKVFAWASAVTGLFLFLPSGIVAGLYLDKLPPEYKAYAGIAFVGSTSFLVVNLALWLRARVQGALENWRSARALEDSIRTMDRKEIAILREFYIQAANVIEAPVDHPTVAGLLSKRILVVAGRYGYSGLPGTVYPVTMSPNAEKSVSRAMLNLSENPTADEEAQIRDERPNFIGEIERRNVLRGGLPW